MIDVKVDEFVLHGPGGASRTRRHLANRIGELIVMVVEGDVQPPTEKQIKYAIAIARELSLELPAEVLQFRDAMTTFLTIHAEHYRKRKGYAQAVSK